jgi:hypothetical protein
MNTPRTCNSSRSAVAEICAWTPLGVIALYVLLALFSRACMGHWPRYHEYLTVFASPVFKIIGATFLVWGALSVLLAPVLWAALTWRARPGAKTAVRQVALFIAGWLAFVLLVAADPYGFTSFLID